MREPHTNGAGGVIGGQVGCDWQATPNWVLGLQGTFTGADLASTNEDQFNKDWTLTSKNSWYATLTGRIGYAMIPNVLLYGKGGGAWTNNKLEVENSNVTIFNGQATRTGWTVGTGVEWGFAPSWSAFAEANFFDFGTTTSGPFLPLNDTFPVPFTTKQQFETFTVGVNYRFRGF